MPFLRSSTRSQVVECFFCLCTSILPPKALDSAGADAGPSGSGKGKGRVDVSETGTKWNWKCERCNCWNIRDARGEMVSDNAAMHDPSLNMESFNLRARPSRSHLPSTPQQNVFCHACLTNQTLIMNMLANYLPDDNDPTYPSLYSSLPSYLASVHQRYPPVCSSCQPGVDEALRRADQRGQSQALGHALRQGSSERKQGTSTQEEAGGSVILWYIQGWLWWVTLGTSAVVHLTSMSHWPLPDPCTEARITAFFAVSLLWTGHDPLWLGRARGRVGRTVGRETWLGCNVLVGFLRLASRALPYTSHDTITVHAALLAVEGLVLLHAWNSYRPVGPTPLKLVRPVSLGSASRPTSPDVAQTTHSYPTYTTNQPQQAKFGQTSFGGPSRSVKYQPTSSYDGTMDWEPTDSHLRHRTDSTHLRPPALRYDTTTTNGDDHPHVNGENDGGSDPWDAFANGPQRIFARPHRGEETGLEGLMETWGLKEPHAAVESGAGQGWKSWFG